VDCTRLYLTFRVVLNYFVSFKYERRKHVLMLYAVPFPVNIQKMCLNLATQTERTFILGNSYTGVKKARVYV
jgi:hypothetical protein